MAVPTQVYDPKEEGYHEFDSPELPGHKSDTQNAGTSGAKSHSPEELQKAESANQGKESGDTSQAEQPENNQLGNSQNNEDGESLYHEDKGSRARKLLFGLGAGGQKRSKGSGKKKAFIALGGLAGLGMIAVLLVILFVIGLLKIPDFAEHITEYQFARVSRTFAEENTEITAEDAALDSVSNPSVWQSIKNTYGSVQDATWGKLDAYRPQKIIDNMESDGVLKFNYGPSQIIGKQQLQSITINGQEIDVTPVTDSLFFKLQNPISSLGAGTDVSSQLNSALEDALRDDTGVIIRGAVANKIRQELGISLVAWAVGRYQGKSQSEADLQQAQDAYDAINESQTESSEVAPIQSAINAGKSTEASDVRNPTKLQQILKNNGIDVNADNAIANSLRSDLLQNVLNVANPVYKVAMPICIVYDGSLDSPNAGSTIDAQLTEDQRAYYLVASAADQQKAGDTTGVAVGAMNDKLSNIDDSNPEIRAAGGNPNTLNESFSPEASPGGEFSIINALLPGIAGTVINGIAKNACPAITNVWGAVGLTLGNIISTIFTGGEAAADEEAAEVGAQTYLGALVGKIASQFVDESAASTTSGVVDKASEIIGNTLKVGGETAGATFLARLITYSKMNSISNGLTMGTDFDNQADAGGNANANTLEQQEFYGAPLTSPQVTYNNMQDQQYLADATKRESAFDRYLAFSNADSLVSRFGLDLSSNINGSIFSKIFSDLGKVLSPFSLVLKIFSSLDTKAIMAQGANDTSDYGNVQWGFTTQEQNLMTSDPSYQPLENWQVLNSSGDEAAIASTYGPCYTQSMGTLLSGSNPDIVRDSYGNVVADQGICSPDNLGLNNPQYGDLVFRWRLMQSYDATLDQLTDLQSPSASQPDTTVTTNNNVYIVGDSLTVGSRDLGNLQQQMQAAGWNVDQIEATVGDTVEDAIPKVQADSSNVQNAGIVIVALGTNDYYESEPQFSQAITDMVNTIKSINPSAQIYWMNTYSTMLNMANVNDAISLDANSLGYRIIDWNSEVNDNPGKYQFDTTEGIHLINPGGYTDRSAFIVSSIGAPPSS